MFCFWQNSQSRIYVPFCCWLEYRKFYYYVSVLISAFYTAKECLKNISLLDVAVLVVIIIGSDIFLLRLQG